MALRIKPLNASSAVRSGLSPRPVLPLLWLSLAAEGSSLAQNAPAQNATAPPAASAIDVTRALPAAVSPPSGTAPASAPAASPPSGTAPASAPAASPQAASASANAPAASPQAASAPASASIQTGPAPAGPAQPRPPDQVAQSFLLRVQDRQHILTSRQPAVVVDNGGTRRTYLPPDDGRAPDVVAGDHIYSLGIPDMPGTAFHITLLDGARGEARGDGQVEFSPDDGEREISIVVSAAGVKVGTRDKNSGAPSGGGSVGQADELGFTRSWSLVLACAAAGLLLGLFWARPAGLRGVRPAGGRRRPQLFGGGYPGAEARASIWLTPPNRLTTVTSAVVRELSKQGPVLLVPLAEHRTRYEQDLEPTVLNVYLPNYVRPSIAQILEAAQLMADVGQHPILVVETGSTRARARGQGLEHLLGNSAFPVVLITEAGEPLPEGDWPTIRLLEEPGGFRIDDGPVLDLHDGLLTPVAG